MNEYGCRDAPCEKSWKQGNPLSNTIKDTSTIMLTLCLNYVGRVTHDCASILDSIAKGISLLPRFFAWCIPTSIFIQLNDFYTCSTYFSWFAYDNIRSYAYKRSYLFSFHLSFFALLCRVFLYCKNRLSLLLKKKRRSYIRAYARMRTCVALRLYHVLV